jgi:hypothetical protein
MSIQVNGSTVVASLSFPVTGWTTWTVRTQAVSLPAGSVKIRATELPNGPNVDNLVVTSVGTPTPTATTRPTATPTATTPRPTATFTPTSTPTATTPRATATATSRPTATSTTPPVSLLSQGRPAVASSSESASFPASAAVDGNLTGTRWSSLFTDPQWIYVDLGAPKQVTRVVLTWEAAYGSAYQLQSSNDAVNWSTFYSTTTGNGATDDVAVVANGRYIRMNGTARATAWGYSLFELQVYGQ